MYITTKKTPQNNTNCDRESQTSCFQLQDFGRVLVWVSLALNKKRYTKMKAKAWRAGTSRLRGVVQWNGATPIRQKLRNTNARTYKHTHTRTRVRCIKYLQVSLSIHMTLFFSGDGGDHILPHWVSIVLYMVVGHFVTWCVFIVSLRWRSVILCPPVSIIHRQDVIPDGKQPSFSLSHAAQKPGSCQSLTTEERTALVLKVLLDRAKDFKQTLNK